MSSGVREDDRASPPGHARMALGLVVALVAPGAVTLLALVPGRRGTAVPALLYLLAVVLAAALGRLWTGLLAAAVSFAGLDYAFTPPTHTFVVGKGEDLVALAVFLFVAVAVSLTLSAALEQRSRAERREQQVGALYHITSRLLADASLQAVLADAAAGLRALYRASGCRVVVLDGAEAVPPSVDGERLATSGVLGEGEPFVVPLVSAGATVGRIELSRDAERAVNPAETEVLQTFAGQLALAVERIRLADAAASARVAAEASRIRAALFSSVTHDLRTPLAAITASASSLLEHCVPFSAEQREELLRTILEEAERLNRLVGNLMDLSRLRAGALVPTLEQVSFEDLVWSVVERVRPRLGTRPVWVRVRPDVPAVAVDVVQMDQVLTNLLENAARYTGETATITISAVRWERVLEVGVSDTGPGIPAGDRTRVFDEFYRRDVSGRRGGTGLGLTIAQAIVLAHGGTMWIEETPGGGATVRFRIPVLAAEAAS